MKRLHSPDFEARVAARVRAACRSRRADWRVHQRGKQEQRRAVANFVGAVLLIVLAFIFVPLSARLVWDSLPLALLVLAMFALWSGQAFVGGVLHRAKGSPQALALRNLPLLDAQAFDYQWQARTTGQLFSGLPALVLATIVLALVEGQGGWAIAAAAACGAITWWLARALAVWIKVLGLGQCIVWASLLLSLTMIAAVQQPVAPHVLPWLRQAEPVISLLLPTAWPGRVFADTVQHGLGLTLLLAIPTVMLACSMGTARRLLEASLAPGEPEFAFRPSNIALVKLAATPGLPPLNLNLDSIFPKAGPTELEEVVRSRTWLAPAEWPKRRLIER